MADKRQERTRLAIRRALIEASRGRTFEKVGVTQIADRALINRQTFYRYYCDKYELLAEMRRELLEFYEKLLHDRLAHAPAQNLAPEVIHGWFHGLVARALEHRDEYLLLVNARVPDIDFRREQDALIRRVYRSVYPDASDLEVFLFSSLALTLNDYCLRRGTNVDPAEVVAALQRIALR